jgi:ribosomal protein S12 methylthiotransferase accessory factor
MPGGRCRAADETLRIATALMPTLGISRVTDITRMDRLGLPVFASVRPRGKALRVHAGKGLDPLAARVGALMEAIEYAAADPQRSAASVQPMTIGDLVAQLGPGLGLVDFAPELGKRPEARQAIPAVACEEIARAARRFLPAELVFVPYPVAESERIFGSSSTGLASGNSAAEATLHGLFEVLERDALSMNKTAETSCWIEHGDLPAPFSEMAARWRELGVRLAVRYVANEFELPCFEAWLHEPGSGDVDLAGGSGLHVDRGVALARAVCESAQSRLSHIHGGRDDITKFYSKFGERERPTLPADAETRLIGSIFDQSRRIAFADVPSTAVDDRGPDAILAALLGELAGRGFSSVFRHCFDAGLGQLHVVKVVVPLCEDVEHNPRRIGPRLLKRILADA